MKAILSSLMVLVLASAMISCDEPKQSGGESEDLIKKLEGLPTIESQDVQILADGELLDECSVILSALEKQGVTAAFEHVRRLSPLSKSELDEMESLTQRQLAAVAPRFGKVIGHEYVSSKKMGESVTECVYISKCENHILRWRFYFYKPRDKWFLNTFMWDSEITEL